MRRAQTALPTMLLAAAATFGADSASGQSIGCMSMPSRVAQYFGYGYGAGHHAPIARTPAQHPTRVPRHTRVPAAYGPLYPAAYEPIGCYGPSCYPAVVPYAAPAPLPVDDRGAWRPMGP